MTEEEHRVLEKLPSASSFEDIGGQLGLQPPVVRDRAISIYRKLGVVSRHEAVERALALGLVADDGSTAYPRGSDTG